MPQLTSFFDGSQMRLPSVAACVVLLGAVGWVIGVVQADQTPDFARDVQAVLSENCFHCHGPDSGNRQADLRLDNSTGIAPMLSPGDRSKSELYRRLITSDQNEVMPPIDSNRRLTPTQIEAIGRWIDQGAPWESHWAFSPIIRPELPPEPPREPTTPLGNPGAIDRFVRSNLAQESIKPTAAATPEARLRRLTLDLTGLPPTLAEIDSFLADPSPSGYERAVDRLLQSPAFGERMAWDWLDAARYADSNGYQGDGERTMWPWRDWVVEAFNRNLPFDQFTLWQIAGDRIPQATDEQRLASGFFRNHMINGEGGRIAEENRVEYVFDMTETLGTVWLGLTLNCCRCHDHKFDPLTKQDYYRLFAYFNQTPVNGGGGNPQTPPIMEVPSSDQSHRIEQLDNQLEIVRGKLKNRTDQLTKDRSQWERETLEQLSKGNAWQVLLPTSYSAESQTLSVEPDGSLLASGPNPEQDTYRITYHLTPAKLTGLRIEALRHESMTSGGLARSDSGNFVLTHWDAELRTPGQPPVAIKFSSASASFEQGGFPVNHILDNDPASGWAVYAGKPIDRDHQAVLVLAEPVEVAADTELVVTWRHQSPHRHHNLGRFRLSASTAVSPSLADDHQSLIDALRAAPEQRNDSQQAVIRERHLASDPDSVALNKEIESINQQLGTVRGAIPKVMIMGDLQQPRKTFMLEIGLYNKLGDEVSAGVPNFLPGSSQERGTDRLGLAQWIVDDQNPLMARVTVNRIWQSLFGIGIVKTSEDFGVQGEIPRHRDLLDWLAADFRDSNWDIKALIRQIVTSDVYQQSSQVDAEGFERDPENRLLARGPRRRLPAWMLRDQALAISGLLVPQIGGAPVRSYQPPGIWEEATFGKKRYVQDKGDALHRRTLYTFWRRIVAPTMLFDNASRQVCTVTPFLTNTPLHALTTLNETTFVEAARALAERVLTTPAPDPATASSESLDNTRIKLAFRMTTARYPSDQEVEILVERLSILRNDFQSDPKTADQLLSIGESPRNKSLDSIEHAAWATLCSLLLNLDETISKP